MMPSTACIDLFCGAGGLTHGLIGEGVPVVAGLDIDTACRYAYESNNDARFVQRDVSKVAPEEITGLFGDADVRILAGCAPCQPFSTYAQRYDSFAGPKEPDETPRWALLNHFSRLVAAVKPEVVTMENVPTVGKHRVYADFVDSLERHGYHVWHDVVDCSHYGLPQQRRRMVLLASRFGPIAIGPPTHEGKPMSVREAIGALPALSAGETCPDDALHTAASLSDVNLRRIRASKPGGTWRDWPSELRAACHQRETGKTYSSVYGRMEWGAPSPTLTTQFYGFGNGRFGHPEQDRAISLREGAILQGFPRTYSFLPAGAKVHCTILGRMIGNAVPVTLGKIIGQSIRRHLDAQALPVALEAESVACEVADVAS